MKSEKQLAIQLGEAAPSLTDEDVLGINASFPSYIFRRRRTREVWTSCCRRYEHLPKTGLTPEQEAVMAADHYAEQKRWDGYMCHAGMMSAPPPAVKVTTASCPWCGREGKIKELGRTGRRDSLSEYRRAVVFKWHEDALWAIACYTSKHYRGDTWNLIEAPLVSIDSVYRFVPGKAERAARRSRAYAREASWRSYIMFDECQLRSRGGFPEPFTWSGNMGMGYDLVSTVDILKSPFRYCGIEEFEHKSTELMRFLALCTVYPRQVEMLIKTGMIRLVQDMVEKGVPHKNIFDWSQADPRKAFGLDGGELKTFLSLSRELEVLTAYKRSKKRGVPIPMEDWAALYQELVYTGYFLEFAAKLDRNRLTVSKWHSYIERERAKATGKKKNGPSFQTVAVWWRDYINDAVLLGYDLTNPVFLTPKDLGEKHRKTAKSAQAIRDSRRKDEAREKEIRRLRNLSKRYTYSDGRWLIRPPLGAAEIVAEGKALKHCVGGYADRHINGQCTILLLRDRKRPGKALVTIEMRGNKIVQIHGWDDERTACKDNPKRISPRKIYEKFLDGWLAWLAAGSKRDKLGYPVTPEQRKKGAA